MLPAEDTLEVWKTLHQKTKYTHLFEIGLNGGHSAAINLELFPNLKVTSLDIGRHSYTETTSQILKDKFGDRFDYIFCDSRAYADRVYNLQYPAPQKVDAVFIDGGHDSMTVLSDIGLSKYLKVNNVFIDNTDGEWDSVTNVCKHMMRLKIFKYVNDYRYTGISNDDGVKVDQLTHYRFL